MKNENEKPVEKGKITTGKHLPDYPMNYGKSLASGRCSGGFYWNPPASCISKFIKYDADGERWVDVTICRACELHRKCEASQVKCK